MKKLFFLSLAFLSFSIAMGQVSPEAYQTKINQTHELYNAGKISEALDLLEEMLSQYESTAPAYHLQVSNQLMGFYNASNDYEKMITRGQTFLSLYDKTSLKSKGFYNYYVQLECWVAFGFIGQRQYDQAKSLMTRVAASIEDSNVDNYTRSITYTRLATALSWTGAYSESLQFYTRAKSLYEKLNTPTHDIGIAEAIYSGLTFLYSEFGQYDKAAQNALTIAEIYRDAYGEVTPWYSYKLMDLAIVLKFTDQKDSAIAILDRIVPIYNEAIETDPLWVYQLTTVAHNYAYLAEFDKAFTILEQIELIYKSSNELRQNLDDYYHVKGYCEYFAEQYDLARSSLEKAYGLSVRKEQPTGNSADIKMLLLRVMENLDDTVETEKELNDFIEEIKSDDKLKNQYHEALYLSAWIRYQSGRYDEAIAIFKDALNKEASWRSDETQLYSIICDGLAQTYNRIGAKEEAEKFYLLTKEIEERTEGKNNRNYGTLLNNIGCFYRDNGDLGKAEEALLLAAETHRNTIGTQNISYAQDLNNLGETYILKNEIARGGEVLEEGLQIIEGILGNQHSHYTEYLLNYTTYLKHTNQLTPKDQPYQLVLDNTLKDIQLKLPILTEKQRRDFVLKTEHIFQDFYDYCDRNIDDEVVAKELLELRMLNKGLLFRSFISTKNTILRSKDPELIKVYQQWTLKKEQLIKLQQAPGPNQKKKIERVAREAEQLEKELSLKSSDFNEFQIKPRRWQELQRKLRDDEALIEIIKLDYQDPIWKTNNQGYLGIILTGKPESNPVLLRIGDEEPMEGKYFDGYRNSILFKLKDHTSFTAYWEVFEPHLTGIKTIHFSPDGVYHKLNIKTLHSPDSEAYIKDLYDIQLISSPYDLLVKKRKKPAYDQLQLFLFGYPAYDLKSPKTEDAKYRSLTPVKDGLNRQFEDGKISLLPGTQEEIQTISTLASGLIPTSSIFVYQDDKATEEQIKSLSNPSILHIATHGFFFDYDYERSFDYSGNPGLNKWSSHENPMLRSGLLLAGAQNSLQGLVPGVEDGILTADEVLRLNVRKTELVVLSACETGLGDISSGEGVFGLQRAFLQAGANNIIMSLWKVDDQATKEMMTDFYENWLGGKSIRTAFNQAQSQLRETYGNPYYWGAFVLLEK